MAAAAVAYYERITSLPLPFLSSVSVGDLACFLAVSWFVYFLLSRFVLGSCFNLPGVRASLRSYGPWAVVTGASDGIGREYALSLAREGLDVVLISRTKEKLDAVAAEVVALGRKATVIPFDFAKRTSEADYEGLRAQLAPLAPRILINNVGISMPGALLFHELEGYAPSTYGDMVAVDVTALTQLTRIVLPFMLPAKALAHEPGMLEPHRALGGAAAAAAADKATPGGVILNVSSAFGRFASGTALYSEYAACKSYVDAFSRSLAGEYAKSAIVVQCHMPYMVATKMAKARPSMFVPTPAEFARVSLKALHAADGTTIVPHWAHKIQDAVISALPVWAQRWALDSVHYPLRRRFKEKLAKLAAAPATGAGEGEGEGGAAPAATGGKTKKKTG